MGLIQVGDKVEWLDSKSLRHTGEVVSVSDDACWIGVKEDDAYGTVWEMPLSCLTVLD